MSFASLTPFRTNIRSLVGLAVGSGLGRVGLGVLTNNGSNKPESATSAMQYAKSVSQTKTMVIRKKRGGKGKRKVATVAAVKKMITGALEKKQLGVTKNTVPATGSKNAVFSDNVTAKITQGTADGQRVGDGIHLTSLHFTFTAIANSVASFYKYRLIIGWSGEEYNPGTWTTTGLGTSEVFTSSFTDAVNAIVNPKAFTAIYDQIFDLNSVISTVADGVTMRGALKLDAKFPYQSAGSVYGKTRNLYIVMVPYYSGGAPTDIGGLSIEYVVKFTDA